MEEAGEDTLNESRVIYLVRGTLGIVPDLPSSLCAQIGPEQWDQFSRKFVSKPEIATAKSICAQCPEREACLDAAMDPRVELPNERVGIWGGMTPSEREKEFDRRYPNGLCIECCKRPTRRADGKRRLLCVKCSVAHYTGQDRKRIATLAEAA